MGESAGHGGPGHSSPDDGERFQPPGGRGAGGYCPHGARQAGAPNVLEGRWEGTVIRKRNQIQQSEQLRPETRLKRTEIKIESSFLRSEHEPAQGRLRYPTECK